MTNRQAASSVRQGLAERSREILLDLKEPNLQGMRSFVCLLDDWVVELNHAASLAETAALLVRSVVLQSGFPALEWCRRDNPVHAADWILRIWETCAGAEPIESPSPPLGLPEDPSERDLEFLAVYNLAVSELLATRLPDAQARLMLRRLMSHLGLSFDHVGRMLDVSGQTVMLWERGQAEVPEEYLSELRLADTALERMLELLRPDRLSHVIRRRSDLFDHEQALDWILRRRIPEVAERYQAILSYQA